MATSSDELATASVMLARVCEDLRLFDRSSVSK